MKFHSVCAAVLVLAAWACSVGSAQVERSWENPAGGAWNDAANWNGQFVPAADEQALFNLQSATAYQTTLTENTTVHGLTVSSDRVSVDLGGKTLSLASSELTNGAGLVVGLSSFDSSLSLANGTVSFVGSNGAVWLASTSGTRATLNIDSNASVRIIHLWAGGAATININGGELLSTTGTVKIGMGATVNYNAGTFGVGSLDMLGGKVNVSPGGDKVLRTFGLLGFPHFSRVDLNDNGMVVRASNHFLTMRSWITQGYNNGDWLGNGITSSMAAADPTMGLGYLIAREVGIETFMGQSVDPNDMLIKYTFNGDTNLDGVVDITDLSRLALYWQRSADWRFGDFNYDGKVNVDDLGLLAANWQKGAVAPPGQSLAEALASLGLPDVTVPEPHGLGIALALAAALRARPRRRAANDRRISHSRIPAGCLSWKSGTRGQHVRRSGFGRFSMRRIILPLALLLFGFASYLQAQKLVVHEWGTFTSLQDESGRALGAINEDTEVLPDFVKNLLPGEGGLKGFPVRPSVTMRLETPVVYFHLPAGAPPRKVSFSAAFHGGLLTQFYPTATPTMPADAVNNLNPSTIGTLTWTDITVGTDAAGPATTSHVWLAPREVSAANLTAASGESERYLFYRGVANLDSPLRVVRHDRHLRISASEEITQIWYLDVRPGGRCAYRRLDAAVQDKPGIATPADFDETEYRGEAVAQLQKELHAALTSAGLFDDEAAAMLKTWNESYFHSTGSRVLFLVPRRWIDRILPITVSEDATIERAMIGRVDLITPKQRELAKLYLAMPDKTSAAAQELIRAIGRFANPILTDEATRRPASPVAQ